MVERILPVQQKVRRRETKPRDKQRGSKVIDPFWNKAYRLHDEAKRRAYRDSIDFNLDPEWVYEGLVNKCSVTGLNFELFNTKKSTLSPSIDRIDNNLGYIKDNCRLVIWWYNDTKGTSTDLSTFHLCALVADSLSMKLALSAKRMGRTTAAIT